jgi:ribonuclease Z
LDHVGGIFPLFDAMGWARNTPLHVWGPTGYTPELGITAFVQNIVEASEWHIQNKQNILPKAGMTMVPHEVDISKFSPEHPRELAYDENGVKIYAFPVIHALAGSMGYRLEWNGLTLVYTADSQPSTFEAEQGKGADVFIHEIFPSAEEFAHYNHMPIDRQAPTRRGDALHAGRRPYRPALPALAHNLRWPCAADARPDDHQRHV